MSENDVRQVAAYIKQELGIDPILADPREFLILAWDRRSAEMFREALTRLSASGAPVPGHVLRDLDEWLSIANPSEDPSVALVEAVLRGAATHLEATAPSRGNRPNSDARPADLRLRDAGRRRPDMADLRRQGRRNHVGPNPRRSRGK